MKGKEIQELMKKYQSGQIDEKEHQLLEEYIEKGYVNLEDLEDLDALSESVLKMKSPEPDKGMHNRFYAMLYHERSRLEKPGWVQQFARVFSTNSTPSFAQLAMSIVLVGFGVFMGTLISGSETKELVSLSEELKSMKEVMMLTLLENESPSDRLKAVSLTNNMVDVQQPVIDALFRTLNEDENDNVRMATIDALASYVQLPSVRAGLVASISKQHSEMVQLALAELMVAIQEKSAVKPLQDFLNQDHLDEGVKQVLEENIRSLI